MSLAKLAASQIFKVAGPWEDAQMNTVLAGRKYGVGMPRKPVKPIQRGAESVISWMTPKSKAPVVPVNFSMKPAFVRPK